MRSNWIDKSDPRRKLAASNGYTKHLPQMWERDAGGFVREMSYTSQWVAGNPEKGFFAGARMSEKEKHFIQTYRCIQCGFLEAYAKGQGDVS